MSCFEGRMKEYDRVSLDRFDGKNLQSTVYFLSHLHEDHTVGLGEKIFFKRLKTNKDIFLYCSEVTHVLLVSSKKYHHLEPYIKPLNINTPTSIPVPEPLYEEKESITVTLLPAFHCPGSVMFLIEGKDGTVLYTGDFRWEHFDIEQMHHLRSGESVKKIKSLYVDTTFCSLDCLHIPSRKQCIDAVCQLVHEWTLTSPQHIVNINLRAQYGHELLLKAVACRLGKKVHVSARKVAVYDRIQEFYGNFTADGASTQLHACDKDCMIEVDGKMMFCREVHDAEKVLVILPTTMYFTQFQRLTLDKIVKKVGSNYFRACYSFHSSYSEVKDLVSYLKPQRVYPNVKPPNDSSLAVTQHRLNTMLKECKEFGAGEVIEPQEVQELGTLKSRSGRQVNKRKERESTSDVESLDFGTPVKAARYSFSSSLETGEPASSSETPQANRRGRGRGKLVTETVSQPVIGTRSTRRTAVTAIPEETTPKKAKTSIERSPTPDLFLTPPSDGSDHQSSFCGSERSDSELSLFSSQKSTDIGASSGDVASSWSMGSFLAAVSSSSGDDTGFCMLDDEEQRDEHFEDVSQFTDTEEDEEDSQTNELTSDAHTENGNKGDITPSPSDPNTLKDKRNGQGKKIIKGTKEKSTDLDNIDEERPESDAKNTENVNLDTMISPLEKQETNKTDNEFEVTLKNEVERNELFTAEKVVLSDSCQIHEEHEHTEENLKLVRYLGTPVKTRRESCHDQERSESDRTLEINDSVSEIEILDTVKKDIDSSKELKEAISEIRCTTELNRHEGNLSGKDSTDDVVVVIGSDSEEVDSFEDLNHTSTHITCKDKESDHEHCDTEIGDVLNKVNSSKPLGTEELKTLPANNESDIEDIENVQDKGDVQDEPLNERKDTKIEDDDVIEIVDLTGEEQSGQLEEALKSSKKTIKISLLSKPEPLRKTKIPGETKSTENDSGDEKNRHAVYDSESDSDEEIEVSSSPEWLSVTKAVGSSGKYGGAKGKRSLASKLKLLRKKNKKKTNVQESNESKSSLDKSSELSEKELEERNEIRRQAVGFICETDSESDTDESSAPDSPEADILYDEYVELSSDSDNEDGIGGSRKSGKSLGRKSNSAKGSYSNGSGSGTKTGGSSQGWLSARKNTHESESSVQDAHLNINISRDIDGNNSSKDHRVEEIQEDNINQTVGESRSNQSYDDKIIEGIHTGTLLEKSDRSGSTVRRNNPIETEEGEKNTEDITDMSAVTSKEESSSTSITMETKDISSVTEGNGHELGTAVVSTEKTNQIADEVDVTLQTDKCIIQDQTPATLETEGDIKVNNTESSVQDVTKRNGINSSASNTTENMLQQDESKAQSNSSVSTSVDNSDVSGASCKQSHKEKDRSGGSTAETLSETTSRDELRVEDKNENKEIVKDKRLEMKSPSSEEKQFSTEVKADDKVKPFQRKLPSSFNIPSDQPPPPGTEDLHIPQQKTKQISSLISNRRPSKGYHSRTGLPVQPHFQASNLPYKGTQPSYPTPPHLGTQYAQYNFPQSATPVSPGWGHNSLSPGTFAPPGIPPPHFPSDYSVPPPAFTQPPPSISYPAPLPTTSAEPTKSLVSSLSVGIAVESVTPSVISTNVQGSIESTKYLTNDAQSYTPKTVSYIQTKMSTKLAPWQRKQAELYDKGLSSKSRKDVKPNVTTNLKSSHMEQKHEERNLWTTPNYLKQGTYVGQLTSLSQQSFKQNIESTDLSAIKANISALTGLSVTSFQNTSTNIPTSTLSKMPETENLPDMIDKLKKLEQMQAILQAINDGTKPKATTDSTVMETTDEMKQTFQYDHNTKYVGFHGNRQNDPYVERQSSGDRNFRDEEYEKGHRRSSYDCDRRDYDERYGIRDEGYDRGHRRSSYEYDRGERDYDQRLRACGREEYERVMRRPGYEYDRTERDYDERFRSRDHYDNKTRVRSYDEYERREDFYHRKTERDLEYGRERDKDYGREGEFVPHERGGRSYIDYGGREREFERRYREEEEYRLWIERRRQDEVYRRDVGLSPPRYDHYGSQIYEERYHDRPFAFRSHDHEYDDRQEREERRKYWGQERYEDYPPLRPRSPNNRHGHHLTYDDQRERSAISQEPFPSNYERPGHFSSYEVQDRTEQQLAGAVSSKQQVAKKPTSLQESFKKKQVIARVLSRSGQLISIQTAAEAIKQAPAITKTEKQGNNEDPVFLTGMNYYSASTEQANQ